MSTEPICPHGAKEHECPVIECAHHAPTSTEWAEESTQAFFAQWLKGEDLEAAIGWCESLLKTQKEQIVREVMGEIDKICDKWFIDFSAIPKKKRMEMDDSDIGFMHGVNDVVDEFRGPATKLKRLLGDDHLSTKD